jgi:Ca2+-binding EF-hand superfamily protein
MDAVDEYDVRASFEALDSDHEGALPFPTFYTLYLGLGFQPQRIPEQELRTKFDAAAKGSVDGISIEECVKVLSQVSNVRHAV